MDLSINSKVNNNINNKQIKAAVNKSHVTPNMIEIEHRRDVSRVTSAVKKQLNEFG